MASENHVVYSYLQGKTGQTWIVYVISFIFYKEDVQNQYMIINLRVK